MWCIRLLAVLLLGSNLVCGNSFKAGTYESFNEYTNSFKQGNSITDNVSQRQQSTTQNPKTQQQPIYQQPNQQKYQQPHQQPNQQKYQQPHQQPNQQKYQQPHQQKYQQPTKVSLNSIALQPNYWNYHKPTPQSNTPQSASAWHAISAPQTSNVHRNYNNYNKNNYNNNNYNGYDTFSSVQSIIPKNQYDSRPVIYGRPQRPTPTSSLPPLRQWLPQASNNQKTSIVALPAQQPNRRVQQGPPVRRRPHALRRRPVQNRFQNFKEKCYTIWCQVRDAFTSFFGSIF